MGKRNRRASGDVASSPILFDEAQRSALAEQFGLSSRELDVLQSQFAHETQVAAANRLGVSVATIHTYTLRLYRKMSVASRSQALLLAVTVTANGSAEAWRVGDRRAAG